MAKYKSLIRQFGGKTYVRGMTAHSTKSAARRSASAIRSRGRLARIVKTSKGYVVYQRKA